MGVSPAYGASGDQLWVNVYNGPSNYIDSANSVAVSPDRTHVYATGDTANPGSGEDYETIAYDSASGVRAWSEEYNGPGNDEDVAIVVAVSLDGI